MGFFFWPTDPKPPTPKCECGAAKDAKPEGHSGWCPKHASGGRKPFVLKDYKKEI